MVEKNILSFFNTILESNWWDKAPGNNERVVQVIFHKVQEKVINCKVYKFVREDFGPHPTCREILEASKLFLTTSHLSILSSCVISTTFWPKSFL